uniref:Uncharacterized protein n=1 Tax=Fagus sylvatica TaxID=28930 RepID=A0A2N9I3K5_FAGSY
MGKTTLARVVYGMVSKQFEACSFIVDVREVYEKAGKDGLLQLQKQILNELLMERDVNIHDVDNGVLMIKNRLRHKKILLVLDDVNKLGHLKKLAGEHGWFGPGSRVIITTRDKQLLVTHSVNEIYEVEALDDDEALQLFSLKAFKKDHPAEYYAELSQAFVSYAKGLPLAIEVLGSFLFNRSIDEWKCELDRLKEFPKRDILDVLKISFDGLEALEKNIFLNIACFFNHMDQDSVIKILGYLELYPIIGLSVLYEKSLLKMNHNYLWMHDLLQEMGRDIVRQECLQDPGKRSRLWLYKDINSVLTENTGTKAVQGIVLDLFEPKEVDWNLEGFSKMQYLKLLKIRGVQLIHDLKHLPNSLRYLDWSGCPLKSLPISFQSNELIELCMRYSKIERLWKGTKPFEKLKFIRLDSSHKLIETPDLTKVPNLEELVLEDCIDLLGVHPSIGVHKKLKVLNLKGCKNLKSLPSKFEMESLEILILSRCAKVKKIPEFGGKMKCLCKLYLDGIAISKLPASIEYLTGLASLILRDCKNLVCVPSTIFNLKLLKDVDISGCSKFERLPEILGNAESVEELDGLFPFDTCMVIVIPGSEIPEWFSHQSINWSLIVNGNEIRMPESGVDITTIASDHILLSYCSTTYLRDRFSKSLVEYDANGFCEIGIRFEIDYGDKWSKEVKKCGFHLLYKEDIKDPIPTDSDSDSTLVTEGNKVKQSRDEYDGAGPSGEGSSNDVPHPKRIERPTEFGNSDSEESSEYKDCDEELSDVQ